MAEKIEIKTNNGIISGNKRNGYSEFLGIRYATAERFEDPIPAGKWAGVYDASNLGPGSQQYCGLYGEPESDIKRFYIQQYKPSGLQLSYSEEDGLALNIFAPENAQNCPVLFYIHGGGYTSGSCNEYLRARGFAKEGIVAVFINYRLGFFASPVGDGYHGNLAFKDQLCAFAWVKDNIASFGGDPDNICICGESAGAYSVQNFLDSPKLPEGAFKSAIMMSGAGDTHPLDLLIKEETVKPLWNELKKELGIKTIGEMKNIDAKDIWKKWSALGPQYTPFFASPVIDGDYLVESTGDAVNNGHMKNVPLMIGMLSEDMFPICLYQGIMGISNARKALDSAPVYVYFMDHSSDAKFGAYHAADIAYAFRQCSGLARPLSEADLRCEEVLFSSFVNFIKFSNPNKYGETRWQSLQDSDNKFFEIDGEKFEMITPDINKLKARTMKNIPFPHVTE